MSDISALGGYGSNPSLVDILTDGKGGSDILQTSTTAARAEGLKGTAARKAASAYGGGVSASEGQAALRRAISELQGKVDGTLTFAKIAEYQKELEAEFTTKVRADLLMRGVDPSVEFTLKRSAEGAVEVVCDDPAAKAAIEDYLQDKPEVSEDFSYIQALANFERAKQSPARAILQGLGGAKAAVQAQALEAFFGAAMNSGMNYSSLAASFSGADGENSANFFTGIDYLV